MRTMRIGAFGDLHGERFMKLLTPSLPLLEDVDMLLLAGDITDKDDVNSFARTMEIISSHTDAPIVSVFGNEEYSQSHEEYRRRLTIPFMDDESLSFKMNDMNVRVVGTTGSLDRPTWWQRNHFPGIWQIYRERVQRVSAMLGRGEEDLLLLLMHYAPTYQTLEGENENRHPEMGSKMFEEIIETRKPDLVIHGHSHRGRKEIKMQQRQTNLKDFSERRKSVPVLNVALPLMRGVTIVEVERDEDGIHITRVLPN